MARFSLAERNAYLDARASQYNSGTINFYTAGSGRPATADTAITDQVLLATCTFGSTAFGAANAGTITANAVTQDSAADAAGIPAFARLKTSGGTALVDLSVGYTGSGAEVIVSSADGNNNAYITKDSIVSISSLAISFPVGS